MAPVFSPKQSTSVIFTCAILGGCTADIVIVPGKLLNGMTSPLLSDISMGVTLLENVMSDISPSSPIAVKQISNSAAPFGRSTGMMDWLNQFTEILPAPIWVGVPKLPASEKSGIAGLRLLMF